MDLIVDGEPIFLPMDCFVHLISFLDLRVVLFKLSLVSTSWHQAVAESYVKVHYAFHEPIAGQLLRTISDSYSSIRRLEVYDGSAVELVDFESFLLLCSDLTTLIFQRATQFHGTLRIPRTLHRLRLLDLTGAAELETLVFENEVGVTGVPPIEELVLSECACLVPPGSFFDELSPTLKRLSLRNNIFLDTDDIETLGAHWTGLESLDLSEFAQSHGLTDLAIVAVASVCGKTLRSLHLRNMKSVTVRGFNAVARECSALRELSLGGCKGLTNETLRLLESGCPMLSSLDVSNCLPLIHGPNIADSLILAERLVALRLQKIRVSFLPMSEAAFALLAESESIRELDCSWCQTMTDFCLKTMAKKANRLEVLNITSCKRVTDWGLIDLAKFWGDKDESGQMRELRRLVIKKASSRLTRKGIKAVHDKFENCVIFHDPMS